MNGLSRTLAQYPCEDRTAPAALPALEMSWKMFSIKFGWEKMYSQYRWHGNQYISYDRGGGGGGGGEREREGGSDAEK